MSILSFGVRSSLFTVSGQNEVASRKTPCVLSWCPLPSLECWVQATAYWREKKRKTHHWLSVAVKADFIPRGCMPQFTFQSPHVTAACSWPRFHSYMQWERQGGVCLLHVLWNPKSSIIQWGRICSLLVLLFILQPRQLLCFVLREQQKMEKTDTKDFWTWRPWDLSSKPRAGVE